MSMNRPLPRRPLPKRPGHRRRALGDAASTGAMLVAILLFILFWTAVVLMPTALMAAAIYWLVTH